MFLLQFSSFWIVWSCQDRRWNMLFIVFSIEYIKYGTQGHAQRCISQICVIHRWNFLRRRWWNIHGVYLLIKTIRHQVCYFFHYKHDNQWVAGSSGLPNAISYKVVSIFWYKHWVGGGSSSSSSRIVDFKSCNNLLKPILSRDWNYWMCWSSCRIIISQKECGY